MPSLAISSEDIIAYPFVKKPNHFFADMWHGNMSSYERLRVLLVFWHASHPGTWKCHMEVSNFLYPVQILFHIYSS